MYDIEAIVTTSTPTELKLAANWPLEWLQAPGSTKIQRKLVPGETLEPYSGPVERSEIGGNRGLWPNLQLGDRVLIRCFLIVESR
jgi:hypothetical protein